MAPNINQKTIIDQQQRFKCWVTSGKLAGGWHGMSHAGTQANCIETTETTNNNSKSPFYLKNINLELKGAVASHTSCQYWPGKVCASQYLKQWLASNMLTSQ